MVLKNSVALKWIAQIVQAMLVLKKENQTTICLHGQCLSKYKSTYTRRSSIESTRLKMTKWFKSYRADTNLLTDEQTGTRTDVYRGNTIIPSLRAYTTIHLDL